MTNLIVTDQRGRTIFDRQIVVHGGGGAELGDADRGRDGHDLRLRADLRDHDGRPGRLRHGDAAIRPDAGASGARRVRRGASFRTHHGARAWKHLRYPALAGPPLTKRPSPLAGERPFESRSRGCPGAGIAAR